MIVGRRDGSIFDGPERHVAIPINCEGIPGPGLVGSIATCIWPELNRTGPSRIGSVLEHDTGLKVVHGLVVHWLHDWEGAPKRIVTCLNQLKVPTNTAIATIAMGASMTDRQAGADVYENLAAIEESEKKLVVYGPNSGFERVV